MSVYRVEVRADGNITAKRMVEDGVLLVVVVALGHRREVYKA